MDSYNDKLIDHAKQVSSDIENIINRPLSFSYCDDFFDDSYPCTDYAPIVAEPLVNKQYSKETQEICGTRKQDQKGNTREEIKTQKNVPMKYAPAEETDKREAPKKKDFAATVDIFGEERDDEDFLLNYDINRLFDIQREVAILANALQKYQVNRSKEIREEAVTKSRKEEELNKKKQIIDDLVNDISGLYENLKVRENIIAQKEKLILSIEDEKQASTEKMTEKPRKEQKKPEAPTPKNDFTFVAADDFGLNNISISAINDAISSLK